MYLISVEIASFEALKHFWLVVLQKSRDFCIFPSLLGAKHLAFRNLVSGSTNSEGRSRLSTSRHWDGKPFQCQTQMRWLLSQGKSQRFFYDVPEAFRKNTNFETSR